MFDLTPFRRQRNDLINMFDNIERNLTEIFQGNRFFGQLKSFSTDIIDKGDHYLLEADLPGFEKENINVEVSDNRLTISARHEQKREQNEKSFIMRERSFGQFTRSFDISNIKSDEIKAEYKNGVLKLTLPKKDPTKGNGRKIDIH